jgi:CO/xanthine dehydrogenase Mo-binding subunit
MTAELGPAVQEAAYDARKKLFEFASKKMDALPDRLQSANNMIYVKDDPDRAISFDKALESLPSEGVTGTGSRIPNPSDWEFNVFSAKACEVEVDTETGQVNVLKVATAHEVGRALNPQAVESQLYGGVVMGLGFAMTEEPWIDEKTGTMLNPDLHQYRPGTILECPEIAAFTVEAEDPFFAFSAKALGNGVLIGIAPAVRAAVAHATGIWINDLPITPDKILDALYGTNKKAKDTTKSQQPFMDRPHLSSSVKAKDYIEERGE